MASKRDLVEAQTYSRRRLLTAFVSGAPSGQELEPTKPLRGVVAGVLLSAVLVLGSLAWGQVRPGLPDGWDDNRLVVADTGARYVALDGTLYPVANATSAHLIVPAGAFGTVQVDADDIADAPRGPRVGIEGAPDAPPAQADLVATGWTSCVADDGPVTTLGQDAATHVPSAAAGTGVLVDSGDDVYVVVDGLRHRIPAHHLTAVLRAAGLEGAAPLRVPAGWLHLFPAGSDLEPLVVAGAGETVPASSGLDLETTVGTVVEVSGVGEGTRRYVVDADGNLSPLSDFAAPLYEVGSGADEPTVERSAADVADVRTSETPVAPADWPQRVTDPLPAGTTPCAVLRTGDATTVDLASAAPGALPPAGVHVAPGAGALVAAQSAPGAAAVVALVDESGRAFGLPDPDDELLARLGYAADDVTAVPPAWLDLLPSGPALTVEAASTQVAA